MKTYKKIRSVVAGVMFVFCVVSCAFPRYNKISTQINKDGSGKRIVVAKTSHPFLAGDSTLNPFFFTVTPEWKVKCLECSDSAFMEKYKNLELAGSEEFSIQAFRTFKNIGDCSASLQCDENLSPLLKPLESVKKQFRWFYTYYSFSARYADVSNKLPVSPNQYMTKEEIKCWFQGDLSPYKGMAGWELKNELDAIEKKYNLYFAQIIYESSWFAIDYVEQKSSDTTYLFQMNSVKDTLFSIYAKDMENDDIDKIEKLEPKIICKMLDNFLKTTHFSALYKANEAEMDTIYKQKIDFIDLFLKELDYELIMPGKIIYANAPSNENDTLSWKIEAFQFLGDDHVLEAQSRSANIWAFVVSFFFVILTLFCFVRLRKMRRMYRKIL